MCGILARFGNNTIITPYLKTLKELEYRGYDSFGFFSTDLAQKIINKDTGTIEQNQIQEYSTLTTTSFIAHTRWATHGGVNKENAHPHCDYNENFYVVMNGIIENHYQMRSFLEEKGYSFSSQTDTEVIPQLFAYYYDNNYGDLETIAKIIKKELQGDFSYVLFFENSYVVYKNKNPLIFGINDQDIIVSSDYHIVQDLATQFYVLKDGDIITGKETKFTSSLTLEETTPQHTTQSIPTTTYMEKEILEQENISQIDTSHNREVIEELKQAMKKKEVFIVGAGSSYHAALIMHYKLLQDNILTTPIIASELSSYTHLLEDSLIVAFSQSGETADILANLENVDATIYAIVNTPYSTLDRISNNSVYLNCGKEVSVASTKAFFHQVGVSYLLTQQSFDEIFKIHQASIESIAQQLTNSNQCFLIGKGIYSPLALEGALKIKETTYIHAEGFVSGELKHGSLALIEEGTPVIVLGEDKRVLNNAEEIKTRGGVIIGIGSQREEVFDEWIFSNSYLDTIIVLQLLALFISLNKGLNPDKPRNLAKSVTVR